MFNRKKFFSLSEKQQHKHAAALLRSFHEKQNLSDLEKYQQICSWLDLLPVKPLFPLLSDRYHYHLKKAMISIKEHHFLINCVDSLSQTPYLPWVIYLENLRSGHNVGSILRSVEAFRLGSVYFSSNTPGIDNKKVRDAAMGTAEYVPSKANAQLCELPRPLIALETVKTAPAYFDFIFPEKGCLMLGNEEYGLRPETLQKADAILQIPLLGVKNSLNVSCAFAIVAAHILSLRKDGPIKKKSPR